jgi:hypothetical protein
MWLIRLIFWGLVLYLAYKLLSLFLRNAHNRPQVKGTPKPNSKIDLRNYDVEDVDFKEIKD